MTWLLENIKDNPSSGTTANIYENDNNGYWTLSPVANSSGVVWYIFSSGGIGTTSVNFYGDYGVRPVIIIPKSSL